MEGIIYLSGQNDWTNFEKNNSQFFLMCYTLKKSIYVLHTFQSITHIVKNHSLRFQKGRMALWCCKKWSVLLRGITSKRDGDFYCLSSLLSFRRENKLKSHKKYVKIKIFVNTKSLLKTLIYENLISLIKHHLLFMLIENI